MEWIGFGVALVAVAITFWTWGRFRGAMSQLESEHMQNVKAIESEHDSRVNRMNREATKTQDKKSVALVNDLAPAIDALLEAIRLQPDDDGLRGIEKGVRQAFARNGIEIVAPEVGEAFSATFHEAIESRASDLERGRVAELFRVGWKMNSRCVRPALVAVSSGNSEEE